jgi:hypothetical protein
MEAKGSSPFQRWAAIAAIVSAPLALASIIVPLPAVDWDMNVFSDPVGILRRGEQVVGPLRLSMLLDLFGYYLLIAPVILVMGAWVRARSPLGARLFTGALMVYVLLGSSGAAVLAGASPRLLRAYATAAPEQRFAIEGLYNLLWDAIYGGLWNILEVLVAGIGWLGVGLLLRRERRFVGWWTIVLGVSCLLDAAGNIFDVKSVGELGLYAYLLLAPLWALILGISLLRRPAAVDVSPGGR